MSWFVAEKHVEDGIAIEIERLVGPFDSEDAAQGWAEAASLCVDVGTEILRAESPIQ